MSDEVKETKREFRPGDAVVVTQDFHSSYFRGLVGTVQGEPIQGPTGQTLYRLKIDVPPHTTLIPDKYLQLKSEADQAPTATAQTAPSAPAEKPNDASNGKAAERPRGSFFSRLFSRGK